MKKVQASITLAIDAKAKQMIADGVDLVGFGAGEPDFNTPDNIKVAGIKAIIDNKTKYTPSSGMPDLKNPIAKKLLEDNKLEYKPANIIVSCGAKHSLYNIFMAGINPGDEVIIFSPYWVSYVEMVNMAQGVPVLVKLDESKKFEIDFELLKSKITKKTKMMIINSPSNPTGCVLSKASLEKLAEICLSNNIMMISDEIYEKNLYNGKTHISIASLSKEAKAKTVVVNGVSKSHAMTGWRIGYIASDDMELVKAMDNLQSHSTSNPTTISQMAAIEALKTDPAIVNKMVAEFDKRRKYILQRVNAIPGLTCVEPEGAFYVFPNFSALTGKTFNGVKIENSMNLADALLTSAKVAVVPGVAFGSDVHFRMSYATSMEKIEKGLNRIEEFFKG
ncbi:MAG TPA: pyridoxal phosphate-dependent aminotransferase [Candidatus Goldiibacteriota bacterium]|nr:pyridoxal phosphate-dependent aminotransferase [Candidatus Goldiibacteriota bacterium]